jgi:hypothetical protein
LTPPLATEFPQKWPLRQVKEKLLQNTNYAQQLLSGKKSGKKLSQTNPVPNLTPFKGTPACQTPHARSARVYQTINNRQPQIFLHVVDLVGFLHGLISPLEKFQTTIFPPWQHVGRGFRHSLGSSMVISHHGIT